MRVIRAKPGDWLTDTIRVATGYAIVVVGEEDDTRHDVAEKTIQVAQAERARDQRHRQARRLDRVDTDAREADNGID